MDNSIPDDVRKQIVDFGVWYSGMAKEKVVRAYNRYLAEKYVPETEEDYKLAQYESKHELPPSPIETPSKALSDLKAENERLRKITEYIGRNASKINEHTWKVYKEQILLHVEDAQPITTEAKKENQL